MIDKTKSFEEQIEILKKGAFLNEYWHVGYDHDDKELNLRIFKAKVAYLLNDVYEQLFKKNIWSYICNITKEENQIFIDNIKKNKDKIYEQDEFGNFVIQPSQKRGDLLDAVKTIVNFNEVLSLDGDNND